MAWDYSEKVKDHFLNPRNVGEIEDATVVAEVGSIACGDALRLYLKLDDKEKITDAKFQTFGCGSAIASSSALTEMIKGMSLDEAAKVTNDNIADFLDGLPEAKMHCSVMGKEALDAAVAKFRGLDLEHHDEDEGKVVCYCFGISENKIRNIVRDNGLTEIEQVTNFCKAGGGCQSCHPSIEDIIEEVQKEKIAREHFAAHDIAHMSGNTAVAEAPAVTEKAAPAAAPLVGGMTNLQRITKIQEVVNRDVRPMLNADGGDLELIDIAGNQVMVRLVGACGSCPSSKLTLKLGVERILQEKVDSSIVIVEV